MCDTMMAGGRSLAFELSVLLGAAAIIAYFIGQYVTSDCVQVKTQHGVVNGRIISTHLGPDAQVDQFLGIPFAQPPVGDLRFQLPQPTKPFQKGNLDAMRYPHLCLQIQMSNASRPMSEDCLYLNIYRPRPYRDNRAVMVWIHGGAFIRMFDYTGYPDTNNGSILAYHGDIIVVTVHYRLGIFGSLHTGDDRIRGGNFGLMDQQMALRWVHDNIRDFGGDPNYVTVFGESAGGHSVSNLLLMPENQRLFIRAIIQSGSATSYRGCVCPDYIVSHLGFVEQATGCSRDDPNFIRCLQQMPGPELLSRTWRKDNMLKIPYIPAYDGNSVPAEKPVDLLRQGKVLHKDILIGTNRDEGTMFFGSMIPGVTPQSIETRPQESYNKAIDELVKERDLSVSQVEAIRRVYEPSDFSDLTAVRLAIYGAYGDVTYKCPIQEQAKAFSRLGMKVYQYYLTYKESIGIFPKWMGVAHTTDIQWVFGHPFDPKRGYIEAEQQLSRDVMTWWSNFAKYGYTAANWKTYSCDRPAYMQIDGPGRYLTHNDNINWDKCRLWGY